jgi:hypothetical protein
MRRVFRRLIRRVNTTEWSVSWFEVLPGDDPNALAESLDGAPPPSSQVNSTSKRQEAVEEEPSSQT